MPAVCAVTGYDVSVNGQRRDSGRLASYQGGQQAGRTLSATHFDRRLLRWRHQPVGDVISVEFVIVDVSGGSSFAPSSGAEPVARQGGTHRRYGEQPVTDWALLSHSSLLHSSNTSQPASRSSSHRRRNWCSFSLKLLHAILASFSVETVPVDFDLNILTEIYFLACSSFGETFCGRLCLVSVSVSVDLESRLWNMYTIHVLRSTIDSRVHYGTEIGHIMFYDRPKATRNHHNGKAKLKR